MASADPKPFVINGAGIAGLTAALALARKNHRVVVFEKAEGFEMLGAGLQLSPNAMHVLNELGLNRWILQVASTPKTIEISNGITGNRLASLPLGESIENKFGAPYCVIHRADLQNILFNACKANPIIDVHFSSEVIEMAPHNHGVTAMVDQGGEINEFRAAGLIIADGVWSSLRTKVIGLEAPVYSGKVAWRALVPTDEGTEDTSTHVWFGSKAHVVSYPIRSGNSLNLVVITDGPENSGKDTLSISSDALKSKLKKWSGDFTKILDQKTRWTGWPLFEIKKAEHMAHGPIALIGDAAHAMLPFAAQGAAMAIEDAAVLAEEVSKNLRVHDAFAAYEKRRLPRVSKVAKTARANGRIYHMSGIRSDFRDLGMWLTPTKLMSARQNWIYGWRP